MAELHTGIAAILRRHEARLLADWMTELAKAGRSGAIDKADLEGQARTFVRLLTEAAQTDALEDVGGSVWGPLREMLAALSASRARQGFTPTETATFVFSFKQPLFAVLRETYKQDVEGLAREMWVATMLLDTLGLFTAETFQKSREGVIMRQQRDLLELSTPVVALWDGILALPLIGTPSSRTPTAASSRSTPSSTKRRIRCGAPTSSSRAFCRT